MRERTHLIGEMEQADAASSSSSSSPQVASSRRRRRRLLSSCAFLILLGSASLVGVFRVDYSCWDPSSPSCGWHCELRSRNLESTCHWCSSPPLGFLSSCVVYKFGLGRNDYESCGLPERQNNCSACLYCGWMRGGPDRAVDDPCPPLPGSTPPSAAASSSEGGWDRTWWRTPQAAIGGLGALAAISFVCAAAVFLQLVGIPLPGDVWWRTLRRRTTKEGGPLTAAVPQVQQ